MIKKNFVERPKIPLKQHITIEIVHTVNILL